eukprot:762136-Hanusia_phi.AAC.1
MCAQDPPLPLVSSVAGRVGASFRLLQITKRPPCKKLKRCDKRVFRPWVRFSSSLWKVILSDVGSISSHSSIFHAPSLSFRSSETADHTYHRCLAGPVTTPPIPSPINAPCKPVRIGVGVVGGPLAPVPVLLQQGDASWRHDIADDVESSESATVDSLPYTCLWLTV